MRRPAGLRPEGAQAMSSPAPQPAPQPPWPDTIPIEDPPAQPVDVPVVDPPAHH